MRHSQDRVRLSSQARRDRKAGRLGGIAALLSQLLPTRRRPVTHGELRAHDYPTSTQRMGIRFTERIRDVFRFRWLRKIR